MGSLERFQFTQTPVVVVNTQERGSAQCGSGKRRKLTSFNDTNKRSCTPHLDIRQRRRSEN